MTMDAIHEEELRRSNEQLLEERTRALATLLSVQQAITSRLDHQLIYKEARKLL